MNTQIDLTVIDRMFSAQLSMNQSKDEMDALRPKERQPTISLREHIHDDFGLAILDGMEHNCL